MTVDSSCPDRSVIRTIHVVRHLAPLAAMSHWVELETNFQTCPRPCIEKNEIENFVATFFTFCKMN